jgi:hypothetical protein
MIVFVTLVSTRVFRTQNIASLEGLAVASRTVDARINASEAVTLSQFSGNTNKHGDKHGD